MRPVFRSFSLALRKGKGNRDTGEPFLLNLPIQDIKRKRHSMPWNGWLHFLSDLSSSPALQIFSMKALSSSFFRSLFFAQHPCFPYFDKISSSSLPGFSYPFDFMSSIMNEPIASSNVQLEFCSNLLRGYSGARDPLFFK
jgi:hypothetical protein